VVNPSRFDRGQIIDLLIGIKVSFLRIPMVALPLTTEEAMQTAQKYTNDVTARMERSLQEMAPRIRDGKNGLPNTRGELTTYVHHLLSKKHSASSSPMLGRDSCNWSTD
jgi:hypothetical protein